MIRPDDIHHSKRMISNFSHAHCNPKGMEPRIAADPPVSFTNRLPALLGIGLIAGTLDITDALVFNDLRGVAPKVILQYIASGVIGAKAFQGGIETAALGLVLHYVIAFIWTGIFYAFCCKFAALMRHPVASGLLYDAAVYLIMNVVVLPLSAIPHRSNPIAMASLINGVLAVVLFIGLAISLLMRRLAAALFEF
jgi:hypothetical protein